MQDAERGKNDITEIYLKIYLIQTDLDMDPKIILRRYQNNYAQADNDIATKTSNILTNQPLERSVKLFWCTGVIDYFYVHQAKFLNKYLSETVLIIADVAEFQFLSLR